MKLKNFVRIVKVLVFSFLCLVSFSLIAVVCIAVWPKIVLNEPVFRFAAAVLAEKTEIAVHWTSLGVEAASTGFLRQRFFVTSSNFCFSYKQSTIRGCTKKLNAGVEIDFSHLKLKLIALGPVELQSLHWSVNEGDQIISGSADISSQGLLDLAAAKVEGIKETGDDENDENRSYHRGIDLLVQANTDLPDRSKLSAKGKVNVNYKSTTGDLKLSYGLNADYELQRGKIFANLQGFAMPDRVFNRISGRATDLADGVKLIVVKNCDLDLSGQAISEKVSQHSQFRMHCPIRVSIPVPPKSRELLKIPTDVGILVKSELSNPHFPPDLDSRVSGEIVAEIVPLLTPFFRGQGSVKAQVAMIPKEPLDTWKVDSKADLQLQISSFERLVQLLKKTAWMVPAPFYTLQGKGELKASGDLSLKEGRLPFTMVTHLRSEVQAFDLEGNGSFGFLRKDDKFIPEMKANVVLSNVRLALPRLNWAAPPQLLPDARFVKVDLEKEISEADSDSDESGFKYQVAIKTAATPVRIISSFSEKDIPASLDLLLQEEPALAGKVRIGQFPVSFFRREAKMEKLTLDLKDPLGESRIDGSVRVAFADYTIHIRLGNTIDKPEVKFSSDPPLTDTQIISVLLFGKPEQLDPEQGSSVQNTRAAVADGALTLVSLYALASTPIQSVGYDSNTGVVSAKVKLGEGISLNLGRSNDLTTVGIRKRLGGYWTITTDVTRNTDGSNVASAYLEWQHRY